MSAAIGFDSASYDQSIAQLGKVSQDLADGTGGPLPLTGDVQLQPTGQTWQPAVDLVAAGRIRFGAIGHNDDSLANSLTGLLSALRQGRSIFHDTEDLATVASQQFEQAVGHRLSRIEGIEQP